MEGLLKRILYSDMDGTLISSDKTISSRNREAIRRFVSLGGKFSVATGRSEVIAFPFLTDITLNAPAILYNGAAVYDFTAQKFLWRRCLPPELVRAFRQAALEVYPRVCVEVYTDGLIQLLNRDCILDHYIPEENQPYAFVEPGQMGQCMKLLFYGENARLREVEKRLYEMTGGRGFLSTFSAPFYLEILPANASKGEAMRWIVESQGEDADSYAAIGDFYNDVGMLQAASLSVCPSNAPEDVKVYASLIVSDNNHDAVADLIENHLIIQE